MILIYVGILIAGAFTGLVAWRRIRSRVVVHRVDYAEDTLTVKNVGRVGARSVQLLAAENREGVRDIAYGPPYSAEGKLRSRRLEDIPPGGLKPVDLAWIKIGDKFDPPMVCVGAKWKPDSWLDRVVSRLGSAVSRFVTTGTVSLGDPWRLTSVTIPGYSRGKREVKGDEFWQP